MGVGKYRGKIRQHVWISFYATHIIAWFSVLKFSYYHFRIPQTVPLLGCPLPMILEKLCVWFVFVHNREQILACVKHWKVSVAFKREVNDAPWKAWLVENVSATLMFHFLAKIRFQESWCKLSIFRHRRVTLFVLSEKKIEGNFPLRMCTTVGHVTLFIYASFVMNFSCKAFIYVYVLSDNKIELLNCFWAQFQICSKW